MVVAVVSLLRPKKLGTSLKTGCAVLEKVSGDPFGYRSLRRALDEPALVWWLGGTQEGLPRLQSICVVCVLARASPHHMYECGKK